MRGASTEDGYTLTEMLVVIGIIGLIASVLTPTVMGQMSRARAKAARFQLETVSAGVEMFMADTGRYPTAIEGLGALAEAPADAVNWTGPYVRDRKALNDPWGRPLLYRLVNDDRSYVISTHGADGKPGGSGAAADIDVPEPAR